MNRTDIHRPAVLVPEDYEFVAFEYIKLDDFGSCGFILAERATISAHMARTGATYSHHAHGGNCHICGAHAIYTALFYHRPSSVYIRTGLDCADKLDCGDVERFRKQVTSALEQVAGKRKAQALLEATRLGQAWTIYLAGPQDTDRREEGILRDIVGWLVQHGRISDPQMTFLRRLVDGIVNRPTIEAARLAESLASAPVPITAKRMRILGQVLSVRRADGRNVFTSRMLVRHADGWKVWGSIPSAIAGDITTGATVAFDAALKVSDKDQKFGYFSRPTKAEILNIMEA